MNTIKACPQSNRVVVVVVCCFLTLTDQLRIQPWSQDRRNQTKSNRESEISMETEKDGQGSSQQRTSSRKNRKHKQKHTDSRNKLEPTALKRREGRPISSGIQPRHEDKGNGCNTQRNKNTDGEKETTIN